jgi:hypothetical protein
VYLHGLQNRFIVTTLCIAVVVFLVVVWPTPYRYDRIQWKDGRAFPLRVNRFTGTAEWLLPGVGWALMTPSANRNELKPTDQRRSLSGMDRAGIDLSQLRWESSFIKGPIYNPTNYRLEEIVLLFKIFNKKDQKQLLEREYRETIVPISSQSVGEIIFDAGIQWQPDQGWNITVIEAKGTPEAEIKTAKDFQRLKLHLFRDPEFRALSPDDRVSVIQDVIQTYLPKEPSFRALPQAEQVKVVEFLKGRTVLKEENAN